MSASEAFYEALHGDTWEDPIPLGDTDDIPMFPVEALPDWIADYVESVADEMQVAVDLPAVLALAALAVVNAGYRVEIIPNGWQERLNIFVVVALPPSSGKSPVLKKMVGVINQHEINERRALEERIEHVTQKRRMTERLMKRAEEKGDGQEARRYLDELLANPLPVVPRWIAGDVTAEALAQLLAEQNGRMALISSEGGPFDIMAGRYSDRANLDVYLQAWSGDAMRVDRIGRPPVVIEEPTLTVGLTVQPSVIAGIGANAEFRGRGLPTRFMYSIPVDNVGHRNLMEVRHVDHTLRQRYDDALMAMIRHQPADTQTVKLSDAARQAFFGWRQSLEDRRRLTGDLRPMSEWSTKLESTVCRVAALLALADGMESVEEHTMNRAVAIGTYWLAHAKIVHDMWEIDPRVANARAILAWAAERRVEEFSVRDVYAAMRKRFPTADDTREPLGLLTERGWIRPLFDGPLVIGRRGVDSPRFSVHPSNLWTSDAHARHARHVLRTKKEDSSSSSSSYTSTEHNAHDAHDAHDETRPDDDVF